MPRLLPALLAFALLPAVAAAQEKKEPKKKAPAYTRTEDVIYGRKHGLAMTLDVFAPKDKTKANGAGVIFCVSGGWFSAKQATPVGFIAPLVDRGYTVFAVVHGSQPKFTIPEVLDDMHRAVRFVRHNAKKYGVDPDRLGITGGSAGGHLSLMQGTTGKVGNLKSLDPVDRQSSKVQAVACFFPPTDFLNYGEKGKVNLGTGTLAGFRAPFEFWERDPLTNALIVIPYEGKRREIGKAISPVYHVTKDSAPVLVVHGDADKLVPIQQAELMIEAYKKAEVPCELVVKKDAAHGWKDMDKDIQAFADFLDKQLLPREK